MKKIKLEVIVENENAWNTLVDFRKIEVNKIFEYTCSMEDCDG